MISEALRLVRVYHDLNQSEAAERVGLSKSYVSELEKGHKKPTLEVLEKYASAFDLPLSSLLLFAENAEQGGRREGARRFIAAKTLKMLDWVAAVSEDKERQND